MFSWNCDGWMRPEMKGPKLNLLCSLPLTTLLPGTFKTVNEDCMLNGSLKWEQRKEGRGSSLTVVKWDTITLHANANQLLAGPDS